MRPVCLTPLPSGLRLVRVGCQTPFLPMTERGLGGWATLCLSALRDGHLAIRTSAAVDTWGQFCVSPPLGMSLGAELLGHMVPVSLLRTCQTVFRSDYTVWHPQQPVSPPPKQ